MIAIVDGGATKCDWLILDNSGKEIIRTQTIGFNPNVVDAHLIPQEIEKNEMLHSIKNQME
ncbi:MAG: ATPase, partial [Flavobacteriaceae bacterium]